jgi:hypothetical protein
MTVEAIAAAPVVPSAPITPAPAAPPIVAVPPAPAAPVAAPQAPAAQPAASTSEQDPSWLPKRLDEAKAAAKRELLKELGAEDPRDIKAALADLHAKREAEKSEIQKLTEKAAALATKATRADELEQVLSARAKREMAGLSEARRNAVIALAGDDPALRIKTIDALRPSWEEAEAQAREAAAAAQAAAIAAAAAPVILPATPAPAAPQTPAVAPAAVPAPALAPAPPAPPAPLPAPLNTAPAATAPAPSVPPVENHLAVYEALKNHQPFRAAKYRIAHHAAIEAAEKARSGG